MATEAIGLKVAFYLYPCLLLVTLLGAQTVQFYRDRHRDPRRSASSSEQKQAAEKITRNFTRPIWFFQFLLSLSLLASIVVASRQAISRHDTDGKISFPFSAYLVRIRPFPGYFTQAVHVVANRYTRPLTLESYFTTSLACFQIRKGRGLPVRPMPPYG